MAFTRLQQHSSAVSSNLGGGTAPMDKGKRQRKEQKQLQMPKEKDTTIKEKATVMGKGYGANDKGKPKGKAQWQTVQQNKGHNGKGKNKGDSKGKGKNPMSGCYICGQPGHLARDVEQWSTTCQRQNKSKHKMQQDNGMINKMDTMPVGTTETLLFLPAPNSIHSNLHYQHPHHNNHKMDRKTIHQQYMQYIQ